MAVCCAEDPCTVAELVDLAVVGAHPFAGSQLPRIDCFLPFSPAKHQQKNQFLQGQWRKLVRELKSYQVCINIPKPFCLIFCFFSILEMQKYFLKITIGM